MKLADKYVVKEDQFGLSLFEIKDVQVKGADKGVTTKKEVSMGLYFPSTPKGRAQCYQRLIGLGISELEEQSLAEILARIEKTSNEIIDFFSNK